MVFRRRTRRRFSGIRRHFTAGNVNKALRVASTALTVARGVKMLVNTEFKFHDVASVTDVTSTAQVIDLCEIIQGTNNDEREGKSIRLKSFFLRGSARAHSSATASALRVMLVKDLRNNGTVPAITDILQSESFVSPINLADDIGRWRVLMDRTYNMSVQGPTRVSLLKYIKLNHHVFYSGSSATSNNGGSIFLVLISNESTNGVNININTRLRYIDN